VTKKFRFVCLTPDLVSRARVQPPADRHSFLAVKPKDDAPAPAARKPRVPKARLTRF
jgi:hypothetical protein